MKKNKNGNGKGETSLSTSSTGAGQSQESSEEKTTINELPPEIANGEPSSSSLYWTRSRKEAPYPEPGDLELIRKRKIDEDDSSNSQEGQDEATGEGPINNLPPEMLTEILKYVDDSTLFDCRLVSRLWCEISSDILTTRTDIMLSFKEYDTKWVGLDSGQGEMEKYKNNRLTEFVDSIKGCHSFFHICPYARFFFNVDDPSFFDDEDWIEFLSFFTPSNPNPNQIQNQRTKIRRLHLRCDGIDNTEALLLFTEKLKDLLLFKIPRLEEFGLDFSTSSEDYENVKLFPLSKNTESEPGTKTAALSALVPLPVRLPYLKVLDIKTDMLEDFPGIMEDLLNAAVNLTKIQLELPCSYGEDFSRQVFQFLHSLGKLHLIKKMEIDVDKDFLSSHRNSTKHSNFTMAFRLYKLKLDAFSPIITPDFYADATNFISTLLESSKDTLEKLKMPALGFLNELQFPKFTKLKILKLEICENDNLNDAEKGQQLFPRGIRSRSKEIFSTVADLSIIRADWENAFPHEDSIPIFSSVSTMCFYDDELVEENVIAKLGLMCPNLKHCTIETDGGNPEQFNFPQVGREIWTHLKQLESLEVDVDVNLPNHAFPALDSCFTGISRDNFQRLSDLMEAEKTKKKSKSLVKLPESEELRMLTQREHPSILDMKSLKKLTINPHSGKRQHQGKNFFSTKITWISEEFAFKLMPQLQFNGRRPSTTS